MIKSNSLIPLFLAIIVAFGTTLSSTHIHIDAFDSLDSEHVWVQEELNCIICGSVFKFNPEAGISSDTLCISAIIFSGAATENAYPPFSIYQEGRSPPFSG